MLSTTHVEGGSWEVCWGVLIPNVVHVLEVLRARRAKLRQSALLKRWCERALLPMTADAASTPQLCVLPWVPHAVCHPVVALIMVWSG